MSWAPDYAAAAAVKDYVRIADDLDDAQVALAATAASRAVDGACARQFGQIDTSTEWLYTARWDSTRRRWAVPIDDLASDTGLTVTVDGTATTAYTLRPTRAIDQGKVYTELLFDDMVAATSDLDAISLTTDQWGWSAFPDTVVQATLLQASRILARRESPYGIAGSPDQGSEMRLLARLDPDVRMLLIAAGLVRLVAA